MKRENKTNVHLFITVINLDLPQQQQHTFVIKNKAPFGLRDLSLWVKGLTRGKTSEHHHRTNLQYTTTVIKAFRK